MINKLISTWRWLWMTKEERALKRTVNRYMGELGPLLELQKGKK